MTADYKTPEFRFQLKDFVAVRYGPGYVDFGTVVSRFIQHQQCWYTVKWSGSPKPIVCHEHDLRPATPKKAVEWWKTR